MLDLGTTVAGVYLPFSAMNAPGISTGSPRQLSALAESPSGAVVLGPITQHPFVHKDFRSLHNPGFDRYVPLVEELVRMGKPVLVSIAGASPDEYGNLAGAFAAAGAALLEADFAEPYVQATLAPWDDRAAFASAIDKIRRAASVPFGVRLPPYLPLSPARVAQRLAEEGVSLVICRNTFEQLEKLLLEARSPLEVIAVGGVESGYDLARTLAKGARAVQVDTPLAREGPRVFARLERELRLVLARSEQRRP